MKDQQQLELVETAIPEAQAVTTCWDATLMASGIPRVAWSARQVPSTVGEERWWKPVLAQLELPLVLRFAVRWSPAMGFAVDSWALWIHAERRQNERLPEFAADPHSSASRNRRALTAAAVATAVDSSKVQDIRDPLHAAFREIAATIDLARRPVSGRGVPSRVQQVCATVPTPNAHPHRAIGSLNTSIAARSPLRSSCALSHKTDRSTDRARCRCSSSVIVRPRVR